LSPFSFYNTILLMLLKVIALDKVVNKFEGAVIVKSRRLAKYLPSKGSIEVYLISSQRIQRLNKKFRGKNRPTNVLSFQKPKDFPGQELGEVYLDPLYIQKHKEDLTLMLVHGVLHVLGYDHKKKYDRISMQKKESELLSKLL